MKSNEVSFGTFSLLCAALLPAFLVFPLSCQAQSFLATRLSENGSVLKVLKANQSEFAAPKFDDQDAFSKPKISGDGEYVAWLALYPNQGASYSLPLELVVLDGQNRVHRFGGDFGMVFGWCFDPRNQAVVLEYSFPHGRTAVGFELRRIRDEKLLRRYVIPSDLYDEDVSLRNKMPAWAQCALGTKSAR